MRLLGKVAVVTGVPIWVMSALGTKRTSPSCTAHVRFWG